jgi:hypothetical protein
LLGRKGESSGFGGQEAPARQQEQQTPVPAGIDAGGGVADDLPF